MMELVLRPADCSDKTVVAACNRAAYGEFARRVGYEPKPMVADYGALIVEGRVHVLESHGRIVGVLVLLPEQDHLLLYSIAVSPDHQGRGLGRTMMAEAERIARQRSHQRVVLYTNEKMRENIRFYEQLGYETFDRRSHPSRPGSWLVFLQKFL